MSATTTQPMTGHSNQAAPIGALVILVGALALGAVGIAIGQGFRATPASVGISADMLAPSYAQRMSEKGATSVGTSADAMLPSHIQRLSEKAVPATVLPYHIQGLSEKATSVGTSADMLAPSYAQRLSEKAALDVPGVGTPLYSIEELLAARRAAERATTVDPIVTQRTSEARDSGFITPPTVVPSIIVDSVVAAGRGSHHRR